MSLAILFHFLCTQHVSDINISIIRSLRLFCWITTLVVIVLGSMCVGVSVWLGWSGIRVDYVTGWLTEESSFDLRREQNAQSGSGTHPSSCSVDSAGFSAGHFPRVEMILTWGWPLASVYCRSYEWLEPYLLSYIYIHGVYRDSVTFILPLCQARVGLFSKFRGAVCEPRVLCFDSSTYNFTSENFIFFLDFAGRQVFEVFSAYSRGLLLLKYRVHLPFYANHMRFLIMLFSQAQFCFAYVSRHVSRIKEIAQSVVRNNDWIGYVDTDIWTQAGTLQRINTAPTRGSFIFLEHLSTIGR